MATFCDRELESVRTLVADLAKATNDTLDEMRMNNAEQSYQVTQAQQTLIDDVGKVKFDLANLQEQVSERIASDSNEVVAEEEATAEDQTKLLQIATFCDSELASVRNLVADLAKAADDGLDEMRKTHASHSHQLVDLTSFWEKEIEILRDTTASHDQQVHQTQQICHNLESVCNRHEDRLQSTLEQCQTVQERCQALESAFEQDRVAQEESQQKGAHDHEQLAAIVNDIHTHLRHRRGAQSQSQSPGVAEYNWYLDDSKSPTQTPDLSNTAPHVEEEDAAFRMVDMASEAQDTPRVLNADDVPRLIRRSFVDMAACNQPTPQATPRDVPGQWSQEYDAASSVPSSPAVGSWSPAIPVTCSPIPSHGESPVRRVSIARDEVGKLVKAELSKSLKSVLRHVEALVRSMLEAPQFGNDPAVLPVQRTRVAVEDGRAVSPYMAGASANSQRESIEGVGTPQEPTSADSLQITIGRTVEANRVRVTQAVSNLTNLCEFFFAQQDEDRHDRDAAFKCVRADLETQRRHVLQLEELIQHQHQLLGSGALVGAETQQVTEMQIAPMSELLESRVRLLEERVERQIRQTIEAERAQTVGMISSLTDVCEEFFEHFEADRVEHQAALEESPKSHEDFDAASHGIEEDLAQQST
jgi:hypothetical protein